VTAAVATVEMSVGLHLGAACLADEVTRAHGFISDWGRIVWSRVERPFGQRKLPTKLRWSLTTLTVGLGGSSCTSQAPQAF